MKFLTLFILLFSSVLSANSDLWELENIVHKNLSGHHKSNQAQPLPDIPGSYSVSKDMSLHEILKSIEQCRNEESLETAVGEADDLRHISFSCKINDEIIVTETLVGDENRIESFQEMTFGEAFIYPKSYLKLLEEYEIEKVEINKTSTTGLKTLGTFARLGIPILLSFRTSKILAPDRADWQKHFIAGSLISGVTILTTQGILRFISKKKKTPISERRITYISSMAGLLISMLAGGGKEIYDRSGRGTPEFRDAMFTAAGGAMVSMFFAIPFGRWSGWKRGLIAIPEKAY